jgi:hypothetical protein
LPSTLDAVDDIVPGRQSPKSTSVLSVARRLIALALTLVYM